MLYATSTEVPGDAPWHSHLIEFDWELVFMATKGGYRTDINGLRAWAVVAVILYHFKITGFASGFVGVDIFFVISGYLMTRIIIQGLESGSSGNSGFNFLTFYLARARRIIPALAALCLVLLMIGWRALDMTEYSALGAQSVFAVIFVSNYKYWLNSEGAGGYFADMETPNWLLHSWSLSVEWQFYIIFPVILWMAWKLRPNRHFLGLVLIIATLVSFAFGVLETQKDTDLAFYSFHTRAWEMLAGGLVFLWQDHKPIEKRWAHPVELLGFALILLSIFMPQPQAQWPGYRALLPVAGSALVLLANRQNSIWTRFKVTQFTGKISYSLYLWHWPFATALAYAGVLNRPEWVFVAFLLMIAMSVLSYTLIENPSRIWLQRRAWLPASAAIMCIVALPASVGTFIKMHDGLNGRLESAGFGEALKLEDRLGSSCESEIYAVHGASCVTSERAPEVALIGDSHAFILSGAVSGSNPLSPKMSVLNLTRPSCVTVFGIAHPFEKFHCDAQLEFMMTELDQLDRSTPILVVNRWSWYISGDYKQEILTSKNSPLAKSIQSGLPLTPKEYGASIVDSLCRVRDMGFPVYVLLPIPEMGADPRHELFAYRWLNGFRNTRFSIPYSEYVSRNTFAIEAINQAANQCGIIALNPADTLCPDGHCLGSMSGTTIYRDHNHLNRTGTALLIPMLEQIWTDQSDES